MAEHIVICARELKPARVGGSTRRGRSREKRRRHGRVASVRCAVGARTSTDLKAKGPYCILAHRLRTESCSLMYKLLSTLLILQHMYIYCRPQAQRSQCSSHVGIDGGGSKNEVFWFKS